MKVKVEYYATLREKLGVKDEEAEVDERACVEDLLKLLVSRRGEALAEDLTECRVLVNGKDIEGLEGNKTVLKEGDTISLFPPVAGG
ncbi:MAG: molybdopterin synthase sulfur carrier subunit [Thermoprotei archaeon]|nr:MAG: molybdopterin synthase sulfur carrier subunit [Thermoprotei archaeon]